MGTERGMAHRLRSELGDKTFHHVPSAVCPAMKRIRFEDLVTSLETLEPRITLTKDIMERARRPLERMVEIGRGEAAFEE